MWFLLIVVDVFWSVLSLQLKLFIDLFIYMSTVQLIWYERFWVDSNVTHGNGITTCCPFREFVFFLSFYRSVWSPKIPKNFIKSWHNKCSNKAIIISENFRRESIKRLTFIQTVFCSRNTASHITISCAMCMVSCF